MPVIVMKQTLVLGSTVVDVLLNVPSLPRQGEDINIAASELSIGGCAYNVYKTLRLFGCPARLCSPVGSGLYGGMVRKRFEEEQLLPIANLDMENGCCYCLVEPGGERTFLSHHGAEYLFSRSWMADADLSQADSVYISGIDLEEPTGDEMASFVVEHPECALFFAPGPRIMHIPQSRMQRVLCHRGNNGKGPLLHLNEKEAVNFSGKGTVEGAAAFLAGITGNTVVITLGFRGCFCLENGANGLYIPGFPAQALDTVGAGDTHCGALIASLKKGMALPEACSLANKAGAAAVETRGAVLTRIAWESI